MLTELENRKIQGRKYLNQNRLAEALEVFNLILADTPNDVETLQTLGNFYLANGDGKTARKYYERAMMFAPRKQAFYRQMRLADEIEESGPQEPLPTELPKVARTLERLTGNARAVNEDDVARAAALLEMIIASESPAALVAQHLNEIDELLPALIELNIRQAFADGRLELVDSLRKLQVNVDDQLERKEDAAQSYFGDARQFFFDGNILFLLPDVGKISKRMALVKLALEALGCNVTVKRDYDSGRDTQPTAVITSNPHLNPPMLESLSVLSGAGVPIILDLTADFEKQPISHSEYSTTGLGVYSRSNAYTTALALARVVVVPSDVHAVSLQNLGLNVGMIPDGWSNQNAFWRKQPSPRKTINLGWLSTSGELDDLVMIRRFVVRVMREIPATKVVIVGNPQAYRLFESLPENRRMYLPSVSHEEFPYQLSQMDILLAPLRNTPYNRSLSDTVLMEAGARGIPWLASAIPSFCQWQGGGVLCNDLEEWYANLRQLAQSEDLRRELAHEGRLAADVREMNSVGRMWLDVIQQAIGISMVKPSFLTESKVSY